MQGLSAKVAALAVSGVFALAAIARSAQVTYDLGGHGYYENVGTGIGTLSFSSSVTLELDSNGDGTAGDVTLLIGGLSSQIVNDFGANGFVRSDDAFTLTGGAGTLSGSDILWEPGGVLVNHYSSTLFCSGSICASLGLQQGVNPPQGQIPEARYGQSPPLGHWVLSTDLTQILGSTRAVFTIGGFAPPPNLDEPAEWFVFGDTDLGFPVPEPGALALLLAGLAALASQRAATER